MSEQMDTPDSGPATFVWLCRELDPARRLHELILIERRPGGGKPVERRLYEIGNHAPRGLVEHLLALTRFADGDGDAGTKAVELKDREVNYTKVAGFEVPQSRIGDVLAAIDRGLREGPGGFSALVTAQAGFHASPFVFKLAFDMAGSPPVLVAHPGHTQGKGGAPGPGAEPGSAGRSPERGPGPSAIPHASDAAVLAALIRAGRDPRK